MKYRKKPVEVVAVRVPVFDERNNYDGFDLFVFIDDCLRIAGWCGGQSYMMETDDADRRIEIKTLEGTMRAKPGDWIVCGVLGEFYPCSDLAFRQTYEPCEAGS